MTTTSEFVQALGEEIREIKRGGGGNSIKLSDGRFLRELSGLFVYAFSTENVLMEEALIALEDAPADLVVGRLPIPATILLVRGVLVEVGIGRNIGGSVPKARLQVDLSFLLEMLRTKFRDAATGLASADFSLSERLFENSLPTKIVNSASRCRYSAAGKPPNKAQERAIDASFSSPLAVIWGPPGTGKTKTIAWAIEAHLRAGRSVLLVSHANNAVDQALRACAEHLKDTELYLDGHLVRLGKPQEVHLQQIENNYPRLLPSFTALSLGRNELDVIKEARLLATTLTRTFSSRLFPERKFDAVVLDEASMAPLPHLFWAASKSNGLMTIVGDFLQLPPICLSEEACAQRWLGRSIFDLLDLRTVDSACDDKRVTLLDEQYRMVPRISAIPNRFFYKNHLKDAASVMDRVSTNGVAATPLVLIETSKIKPWAHRLSGGSRFNICSALVCAAIVESVLKETHTLKANDDAPDVEVGVVTPYTAQARLIRRVLRDRKVSDSVRVSTIHKFQGGEARTMVFDLCDGRGSLVAKMLDDTKDRKARQVINVALTRAMDRVYLVADTVYMSKGLSDKSSLFKILRYFQDKATTIHAEDVVGGYFNDDFARWAEELLPAASPRPAPSPGALHTEKSFWPHFLLDLKNVKKRLIVVSPFLALARTSKMIEFLRALTQRQVSVRVFTKPGSKQMGPLADQAVTVIAQLKDIGVEVIERCGTHEKIAVLDDEVLWEGSLNILSHNDGREQMRRFVGCSLVEEVVRALELDDRLPLGLVVGKCPGSPRRPNCGGSLVIRRSKYGKFISCNCYPRCDYTRDIDDELQPPPDDRQTRLF